MNENEGDLDKLRKELQTKINEHQFCWICGREDLLTEHHVLNQKLKGVMMNVKIPICQNCMLLIHENDTIAALMKKIFLK